MNKKNYIVSILITVSAIFCSKIDDVTNVGKNLIRDIDPSMVNFEENFKPVAINVGENYSLPSGEGQAAVHEENFVAVGTKDMESSTGYFEFALNSSVRRTFLKSKAIKSIYVQFDLDSITENIKNMNLYRVDTLLKLKRFNLYPSDTLNCGKILTDSSLGQIRFVLDSLTTDSIFSACKNVTYCDTSKDQNTQNGCDTLLPFKTVGFVLFSSDSTITNVSRNAKMVFDVVPDSLENDSVKTLSSSYANYIVYETFQYEDTTFEQPISSFASKRTAVFETDLTNLWKTMDSVSGQIQYNEILSVGVKLSGNSKEEPIDSSRIQAIISDKYICTTSELDSLFEFSTTVRGDSTLLFQAGRYIQKTLPTRPSKVYIYIRANRFENNIGIWDKILWNVPEVKVILTTLN